jgi:hypothetical protein
MNTQPKPKSTYKPTVSKLYKERRKALERLKAKTAADAPEAPQTNESARQYAIATGVPNPELFAYYYARKGSGREYAIVAFDYLNEPQVPSNYWRETFDKQRDQIASRSTTDHSQQTSSELQAKGPRSCMAMCSVRRP